VINLWVGVFGFCTCGYTWGGGVTSFVCCLRGGFRWVFVCFGFLCCILGFCGDISVFGVVYDVVMVSIWLWFGLVVVW